VGKLWRWFYRVSTLARRVAALRAASARFFGKRAGRQLPIVLTQKKLYVLPTGFGFLFAILLFASIAGALNYNNNMALAFGFFFAGLAFLSVHVTHRNLNHVALEALRPEPAYAGTELSVNLRFITNSKLPRTCLQVQFENAAITDFELNGVHEVSARLPAVRRGFLSLPPLRIFTTWPFGFFEVWSHLWPDMQALVYPALEEDPPPLPEAARLADGRVPYDGDEEFKTLRTYRDGDAMRAIAWRASSRLADEELLVIDRQSLAAAELAFDYQALAGMAHEARLSRLASWCVLADTYGARFQLRLPDQELPAGSGANHLHTCLRALALQP
jgi:uncharacterized protein (DUF58 family)